MHDPAGVSPEEKRPAALSWWALALVLAAIGLTVLWPGDVPWQTDEPRLLAQAWHGNHEHILIPAGQYGNFGVPYGPLPIWIYQGLLLLTHDPIALVFWRSLLCAGATGFALLWLGRTLRLPQWFAAAILVTPYITAFHRILWDASFDLPLGAFAIAALADFCVTHRRWPLRVCLACTALLPIIHPQALPLAGAIVLYLLWKKRAALWQDRKALGIVGAVLLAFHAAYIPRAIGAIFWRFSHGAPAVYPGQGSRLISALAPFLGGHLLDGTAYAENVVTPLKKIFPWVHEAEWLSHAIYLLLWLGIGLCVWRTWTLLRRKTNATEWSPRDEISVVLAVCVILQVLLFAALRIPPGAQYFFGVFAAQACLAWLAVDLPRWRLVGLALGVAFGLGSFYLNQSTAYTSHVAYYNSSDWLSLKECVEVTHSLNQFSNPTAETDSTFLHRSPQTLRTLRLLIPPSADKPQKKSVGLVIWQVRWNSDGVGLNVTERREGYHLPPGFQTIEVTPLPKDWVPDPSTW